MEIRPDKRKCQRATQMNPRLISQWLESDIKIANVQEPILSDDGFKPEFPSRIAETTTALALLGQKQHTAFKNQADSLPDYILLLVRLWDLDIDSRYQKRIQD